MFIRKFYANRSHKCKKLLDLTVFFVLLGSAHVKAARKIMVKLTPPLKNLTRLKVQFIRKKLLKIFVTGFKILLVGKKKLQRKSRSCWLLSCNSTTTATTTAAFFLGFLTIQQQKHQNKWLLPWFSCQSTSASTSTSTTATSTSTTTTPEQQ